MRYIFAAILCLFVFSGCSQFGGKNTVTFWHAMSDPKDKTLKALISEFEAKNPGVKIRAEYVGNYDILNQKLLAAAGSGNPPDISQVYENWTTRFRDAGVIIPVADLIAEDTTLPKNELNDIFPVFVRNNSYDNVMWTFPFNKSIYVTYYNTTIFKKAGLNPPYNMEEFRNVAKALTKKDKDGKITQYGFGFRLNIDVFAVLFYLNKGKFFDEKETKALFNDGAGVEALQVLCDMYLKDKTAFVTKEYLDNDFAAGRVASFFATTPRLAEMQELLTFKIGVAPLPGWKTQTAPIAGTNLAVFKKKSMTPEKQKLCWSFIKFISSAEGTSKWAAGTNYLPVRKSAKDTDVFRKYVNENPLVMVGVRQLDRASTDPRNKNWQAVRDLIGSAVEKALLEKATPKEALDEAAAEVNILLEKNK